MRYPLAAATVALLVAASPQAWAQQASVEGDVRDSLGRPIAGANVTLEGADGKAVATTTGDSAGHFVFKAVPAGTYAVAARRENYEEATAIVAAGAAGQTTAQLVLKPQVMLDMVVLAKRLNEARNELSPQTGTSAYTIDSGAIKDLPQGGNTPLNQVLLQAPGVAQDSAASGGLERPSRARGFCSDDAARARLHRRRDDERHHAESRDRTHADHGAIVPLVAAPVDDDPHRERRTYPPIADELRVQRILRDQPGTRGPSDHASTHRSIRLGPGDAWKPGRQASRGGHDRGSGRGHRSHCGELDHLPVGPSGDCLLRFVRHDA